MAEYQIITDATADLSDELAKSLGVKVIPMTIQMDGRDYIIGGEDISLSIEEFYDRLTKGEVALTSQINTAAYSHYFEEELKNGRDVLLISFSSAMSKSTENALTCAAKMRAEYPDRKLYCIDSLCASVGEALLVYAAALKKREGMGIDDLAEWVETEKWKMAHWVTVDELSFMQRGGRISMATAMVGTMLNIKPIIFLNGEGRLLSVDKRRGRKKSLDALIDIIREKWAIGGRRDPVFIGHGMVIEDASYLRDGIMAGDGPKDVRIFHIGPVIGAHTGPSVVAVFCFGDKR